MTKKSLLVIAGHIFRINKASQHRFSETRPSGTPAGAKNGAEPVQNKELMQKMAVFGLTLNPKQGVLHSGDAFSLAPVMFSPRPAAIRSPAWRLASSCT